MVVVLLHLDMEVVEDMLDNLHQEVAWCLVNLYMVDMQDKDHY